MEEKLIIMLKLHDFSYEYSDDHIVWERGRREYKDIEKLLNELFISGINMTLLLEYCLSEVKEQFTDRLTHRIINILFKPYIL